MLSREEDAISAKELAEIVRNRDRRYECGGKDYVLITKEEANHRCMLYASDCE